jgi:hypothetical protein
MEVNSERFSDATNILVLWLCIFHGRVLVPHVLNSLHVCVKNTGIEQTQLHGYAVKYPAYGGAGRLRIQL